MIKSGVPGLDKVLGGGFLEGSITALSGPTGSGRSTLAVQFLYNGTMQYNEPGLYISIEESKNDFFFHMSGYTWDLANAEKERKLIFLDYPIYEVDQILEQYGAIQEIINSTGVKRVVVDSIMPIALFFPSEDERKKGFLKLIDNIRKWNATTLIIAEDTNSSQIGNLPHTAYNVESFTDGWINMPYSYDPKKGDRTRFVEVIKMKGVMHSTKLYPAVISDNGFTILSGSEKSEEKINQSAVKKVIQEATAPTRTVLKPAKNLNDAKKKLGSNRFMKK